MPAPPAAKTFRMIKGDNSRESPLQWLRPIPVVGIRGCHYNHPRSLKQDASVQALLTPVLIGLGWAQPLLL